MTDCRHWYLGLAPQTQMDRMQADLGIDHVAGRLLQRYVVE